jgi:hypothetical protein
VTDRPTPESFSGRRALALEPRLLHQRFRLCLGLGDPLTRSRVSLLARPLGVGFRLGEERVLQRREVQGSTTQR